MNDETALAPYGVGMTKGLSIIIPGVTWDATSLKLPDDLSFENWIDGVRFLQSCLEYNALERRRLLWYWADLMRFGERVYGERAAQAMELGFATGTLYNVAWIGKVEPSCRHENLPFWTHAPVARLEPREQKRWLDRAAEENWTRKQLTEAIEDKEAENDGQDPAAARARRALGHAADAVARLDIEDWADTIVEGLIMPLCRDMDATAFLGDLAMRLAIRE